jgi:hypothetical protein
MERNPIFITTSCTVDELITINRHVLCPQYTVCLDEAVLKDQHFDCRKCLYMIHNIKAYKEIDVIMG